MKPQNLLQWVVVLNKTLKEPCNDICQRVTFVIQYYSLFSCSYRISLLLFYMLGHNENLLKSVDTF